MKQLIESSAGQKIFLIVGNLSVHHGKIATKWFSEHNKQIEIFYLPHIAQT
jgi:hypothetical protein